MEGKKWTQLLKVMVSTGMVAIFFLVGLFTFIPSVNATSFTLESPGLFSLEKESPEYIEGEYIISFKKDTAIKQMKEIVEKCGGKKTGGEYDIHIVSLRLTDKQFEHMKHEPAVETIEKNQSVELEVSGPLEQYSHELTNVPEAWNHGLSGENVKIAVLDTGIFDHRDLNVVGGISMVDYTSSYSDDNGHGTHVAGVIGAKDNGLGTTGVAYGADIYSVKVLKHTGKGDLMDIIAGLDWSIKKNVDIINISLGTKSKSSILKRKIDEAIDKDILVVAATGNSGNTNIRYPAKYSKVVGVGATDQNNKLATFSSRGPEVDVVAPGVDIISTFPGSTYATGSGTSQAAPYVSGMLALLYEEHPEMSAQEIKDILYINTLDLGPKGKDGLYGYGLVQYPLIQEEAEPGGSDDDIIQDDGSTDYEDTFYDVNPDNDHYEGIVSLVEKGVITGYENGVFKPWDDISRQHVAVILYRANKLTAPGNLNDVLQVYKDINRNTPYSEEIAAVTKEKIFNGSNGYFHPTKPINREQVASVLVSALELDKYNPNYNVKMNLDNVDPSHRKSVQILGNLGITNQLEDFRPTEKISRAAFSSLLYDAMKVTDRETSNLNS